MDRPSGRTMIGAIVVAGLAVFASMNSYAVSKLLAGQSPDPYRIASAERRFGAALAMIDTVGPVGYISDMPVTENAGSIAFMAAQYALAPHPLVAAAKTNAAWAIGNFARPADFAALGAQAGYTLVTNFGDGAVIYRRSAKQ